MEDNYFQHPNDVEDDEIETRALHEFEQVTNQLNDIGVEVFILDPLDPKRTPDAVFPNNWFSMHHNGTLFLYPMANASRRAEVRPDFKSELERRDISVKQIIDLTTHAEKGTYLEGTGSLVLDHINRVAFLALSNRSDATLAQEWCTMMNYQLIPFNTVLNPNGISVYHTNVVMAIFSECAIVCKDIIEPMDQSKVLCHLQSGGRKVIEIDLHQMSCFAGNMIELQNQAQKRFFIMSQTAHQALSVSQIMALENFGILIISNIQAIERYGGGGVRCMIAELFDDNNSK
jgi:hypothetical protein